MAALQESATIEVWQSNSELRGCSGHSRELSSGLWNWWGRDLRLLLPHHHQHPNGSDAEESVVEGWGLFLRKHSFFVTNPILKFSLGRNYLFVFITIASELFERFKKALMKSATTMITKASTILEMRYIAIC